MNRVLITGATGLVGSHATQLFRERGWAVRALVRPSSDRTFLLSQDAELVTGDITDSRSLRGAAKDCTAIVHCAARLGGPSTWRESYTVNVEGTANVVAEALLAGVPRLVHVSTVAVYGHPARQPRLPIDESSPVDTPVRDGDHYERSKRLAEEEVQRTPVERLGWCVLRPDVVIGEHDRLFTPRLLRNVRNRLIVPLLGDNDLPLVYAGNVALAAYLAATSEAAVGRTYNVTDDGLLTLRELLTVAAGKRRLLFLPLPPWVLEATVSLVGKLASRGRRHFSVNRRNVWFFTHPDPFDCGLIRRELGWRPTVTTAEGWLRSVRWHDAAA